MTLDELLLKVMQKVETFSLIVSKTPQAGTMYTVKYYSASSKTNKEVMAASPERVLEMVLELVEMGE
jgi:hypothetical protein